MFLNKNAIEIHVLQQVLHMQDYLQYNSLKVSHYESTVIIMSAQI